MTASAAVSTKTFRYAVAERFGPPEVVEAVDAAPSGEICPQLPGRLARVMGAPKTVLPQGEDCLNLAVSTPGRDDRGRPVLVFFHGGAFSTGSGLADWYDGSALAGENDVVVVRANYRLGAFGYLCLDGVSAGNLGLRDQIAALTWIKMNIAAFGGDPAQVTVFGQSAGAHSIRLLMEVDTARGLFQRAILQSGASPFAVPRESAVETARLFAAELDGDPRTADVGAILDAHRATMDAQARRETPAFALFAPVSGADLLPVLGATFDSNVAGLDVLCGWNADDTTAFTDSGPGPESAASTERRMARPAIELAEQLELAGARAHTYRLDWRPAGSKFGATHCVELPLLLGSRTAWADAPMLGTTPWDDVDAFGRRLRRIWATFARTGTIDHDTAAGLPLQWDMHAAEFPR